MNIIFVGGEKGGVGKSMTTCTIAQYFIDHAVPFVLFDTDRSNPDAYRRFKNVLPVKLAIFSEAAKFEDSANGIFNSALDFTTLVNCPAQIFESQRKWIFDNDLLAAGQETGVRFHIMHVSDAGYDSIQLLKKTLQLYQDRVSYTLVNNYGRATEFAAQNDDIELQELLTAYQVQTIALPCFIGSTLRNTIDARSLSWGEALADSSFGVIDKQRIRKFLRETYRELGSRLRAYLEEHMRAY